MRRESRRIDDRPLAQQAALRGNDARFRRYLSERLGRDIPDAAAAAVAVREICGVTTRAALDRCEPAARKYWALEDAFLFWLQHPETHA